MIAKTHDLTHRCKYAEVETREVDQSYGFSFYYALINGYVTPFKNKYHIIILKCKLTNEILAVLRNGKWEYTSNIYNCYNCQYFKEQHN